MDNVKGILKTVSENPARSLTELPTIIKMKGMTSDAARSVLANRWGLHYVSLEDWMKVSAVRLPVGWSIRADHTRNYFSDLLDFYRRPRARILNRTNCWSSTNHDAHLTPLSRFELSVVYDDTAAESARAIVFDREIGRVIMQSDWIRSATPAQTQYAKNNLWSSLQDKFPDFENPMLHWSDLSVIGGIK